MPVRNEVFQRSRDVATYPIRKSVEVYKRALQRTDPDKVATSFTLGGLSSIAVIPVQAGVAYAVKEMGMDASAKEALGAGAIAISLLSIKRDGKALEEEGFSISPTSTAINEVINKPYASSTIGHAISFVKYGVPLNVVSAFTGDTDLLTTNVLTIPITHGLWRSGWNTLIAQGKAEPVVRRMGQAREWIQDRAVPAIGNLAEKVQHVVANPALLSGETGLVTVGALAAAPLLHEAAERAPGAKKLKKAQEWTIGRIKEKVLSNSVVTEIKP